MSLPLPCLMLVTDRTLCSGADGLVSAVHAAVSGGVDAVQLREKDLPSDDLLPLARSLREATRDRSLLLVNGSMDVAVASGADGVHLPEGAPPIERPHEGFLIGRSVHSLDAASRAKGDGADYLIAGPVYQTRSHPEREPVGISLLEEITESERAPALAIGGVTAERVDEVVRAGVSGIATISAVLAQPDRRAAAEELRRALDAAWLGVGAVHR